MFSYEVLYQNEYGVWTELEDFTRPIIIKRTLDETHDEGQIFLSCSEIDTPFKPFTKFIINISEKNDDDEVINTETVYMVSTADEMEQKTFDSEPFLYNHDIRLAEATKELERYTVDNLSFTNYWQKAFNVENGKPYISSNNIFNNWYNNNVECYQDTQKVYYYPNRFSYHNSFDAYRDQLTGYTTSPSIYNTLVYKTLSSNNLISNFTFSSYLPKILQQNNYIEIPTCYPTSISESYLMYMTYGFVVLWDFNKVDVWAQYRRIISSIVLTDKDGIEQNVNAGEQVVLNKNGSYVLKYNIKTQVRFRVLDRERLSEKVKSDTYTSWYDALDTQVNFDIYVVDTSVPDIDKLSIYDVCNRLLQVTPTRFKQTDQQTYYLSSNVRQKYGAIEAPELIFTNKNLWECLRMIGGVINAIPYLAIDNINNWNVIDFFPLSSEEKEADTVEQNYISSSSYYISDSYTSSYDIYVNNMINPLSTLEGEIKEQGWYIAKSMRSEEVEISETSMNIPTVYPIYKVNKIRYVNYASGLDLDLTIHLQEQALYNTLVSNSLDEGKAINLCYTQGKQNITGLQYKVSKNQYADAVNKVAIKKILDLYITAPTGLNLLKGKFIVEYTPYLNARIRFFKSNSPKLNIKNSMFQNQDTNIVDARALGRKMVANLGRTSNLSYQDSLSVFSLDNIPSKGQRSKDGYFVSTITTEYDQNHLLSSIVYTKDYQKISDFINIQNLQRYYEVSEKQSLDRYVNTNMFYIFGDSIAEINKEFGLNQNSTYLNYNYLADLLVEQGHNRKINASLLRAYAYVYVKTEDTTYQDLITYYKPAGDSFERMYAGTDYEIGDSTYIVTTDTNYLADIQYYSESGGVYTLLVAGVDYTIGNAISGTIYNLNVYITSYDIVSKTYLNSNALSTGNCISIITDFQDNYSAGYQAKGYDTSGGLTTDAYMNRAVPYSDKYGQIASIEVQNVTDSNITYTPDATLETNMTTLALSLPAITNLDDEVKPTGSEYLRVASSYDSGLKLPTVSNIGCLQEIQLNKDSREIIHINQQHHFLKNDDAIIIGNAMVEKCRYIQEASFKTRLVFLNDNIDEYEFLIDNSEIVPIEVVGSIEELTDEENAVRINNSQILYDLTQEITNDNLKNILSINGNTSEVYSSYTSSTITGVSTNKTTWETQIEFAGKYEFIYNGTSWALNETNVDLATYGVTFTGTASSEDIITIRYETRVYLQPNLVNNGKIVGLTDNAVAWAILTDTNELLIGKNIDLYADDLGNDNQANAINQSVTSEY